ncbi:MAG: hypothetical protein MUO40_13130, partial [Anaerolineaceae bacterium]|nr:hypothetical protein [Anaerolineaceae bacterium]
MVIFIILTFFGFWLVIGNTRREPDWRVSFVQALILWATYLTLTTEILSLFNWITVAGLSVVWVTPCFVFIVLFWIGFKKGRILRFPIIYHLRSRLVAFMDVLIVIIMLVTLIICFVSPPNSLEAMTYRLPRVAHWAQQQNLGHYAASTEAQNSAAPGYEIILLNFFIMAKGDGWSNIITWLALFGCIEAIMGLAAMFGSTPKGTRLSAMFAVSLPIAIVQASSSLNDLVLGLWIMGCVLMILLYRNDGFKSFYIILAALSAGLAVITKPTALIFLAPFIVYLLILIIKQKGFFKTLGWVLISFGLIVILSGGYLIRNQITYGEVYSLEALEIEVNENINLPTMTSNILRNTALQINIPWVKTNFIIEKGLESFHESLGLPIDDPSTTVGGLFSLPGFNTSELTSGNPLHLLLIAISFVTVFVLFFKKKLDWELFVYVCSILVAGMLFNLLMKTDLTGSSLQMPFFFLYAPIVGFLLGKSEKLRIGRWVGVILFVFALPWIFSVKERPIVVLDGITYDRSILTTKRDELYFTSQ